ncbi:MAG: MgtC/SapB family protein [Prevotella sp.]|nr:MgtC/SapB family protein [Prevotella sp.]
MEYEYLLRIFVAALLGGAIGLEREYRAKEAGFRTHLLVAMGSALFMILSFHGFDGVLVTENHRLDVSRIAAQVVSGIGFIGAGTIIFQRHVVRGLTTAAGLWVTAAIGMASGAGLYLLAVGTMLFVLLGLEPMNALLRRIGYRNVELTFHAKDRETINQVLNMLKKDKIRLSAYSMTENKEGEKHNYTVKMEFKVSRKTYQDKVMKLMTDLDGIAVENFE